MALLELLGGSFLQFFVDGLTKKGERNHAAIVKGREAMRRLAASLSEVVADLEAGMHRLQRARSDPARFSSELAALVDQNRLQANCHEAGVCEDLRSAQDALRQAGNGFKPDEQHRVEEMAQHMDGYERVFVGHVRAFLAESRELDLQHAGGTAPDPDRVLAALKERVDRLRAIADAAAKVSDQLREAARA